MRIKEAPQEGKEHVKIKVENTVWRKYRSKICEQECQDEGQTSKSICSSTKYSWIQIQLYSHPEMIPAYIWIRKRLPLTIYTFILPEPNKKRTF